MQKDGFIDELLAKTDLVKLISEYVPLEQKGGTFWGCCPFHHEKTPSFSVSDSKQLYHCFGCKESGNAFTFVKKMENVDFPGALKILAKRAGLELPQTEYYKRDDAEVLRKKERLYALLKDAARHYHENLKSPAAAAARRYLADRGVNEKLTAKFGLGYSLNGLEMLTYLGGKGYTETEMKDAGIAAVSENGLYDVFYDRLMIPIIDQFGEVRGFGGRTLVKNPDFAKYRNSSQTLVFDKGKTIYAVNLLQKRKQRGRMDYVILCEGYMDVIALHSAGFDTAVASMGTALTFNQAKQLRNFANRIYISYDGDTAGQKAALRGLDILDEAGLSVRVILMPEGLDPDDAVRKHGAEFYQKLMDGAVTLPAFKIEALKKQYDLSDGERKAKFAVEAVRVVKALKNPVEQEEYLKIVQGYTGYSMEALKRQAEIEENAPLRESREPVAPADKPDEKQDAGKEAAAKRFVLASIANNRTYVDFTENFDEFFADKFSATVIRYLLKNRKDKTESGAYLYEMIGEERRGELDEIIYYQFIDGDDAAKYADCMRVLRETVLLSQKASLVANWAKSDDPDKGKKLMEIEKKIKQLKNGGDI